jgi:dienelactone hydrolase
VPCCSFGGEVVSAEVVMDQNRWGEFDLPGFIARNSKDTRWPEILECAKALRAWHARTGAIGFCYGAWGVFRLSAKGTQLVDCISAAHPTLLEKEEIEKIGVPVQIMAPEFDPQFTEELKAFSNRVIPGLGVAYDYQYFPGLEHGFAVRGNPQDPAEMKGMERAKNSAVLWFRQWLCHSE